MSDTNASGITIKDYGQQVPADKSAARLELEARYGSVWDTAEMQAAFNAVGFAAPYIMVVRKFDDQPGTLEFSHSPRLYFDFQPDRG